MKKALKVTVITTLIAGTALSTVALAKPKVHLEDLKAVFYDTNWSFTLVKPDGTKQDIVWRDRPFIYNDRTYVPLSNLTEQLGYKVQWDPETNAITLVDPKAPAQPGSAPNQTNPQQPPAATDSLKIPQELWLDMHDMWIFAGNVKYYLYRVDEPGGEYGYNLSKQQKVEAANKLIKQYEERRKAIEPSINRIVEAGKTNPDVRKLYELWYVATEEMNGTESYVLDDLYTDAGKRSDAIVAAQDKYYTFEKLYEKFEGVR